MTEHVDYPELLRALGYFIQQEHLSEVSILEFDRGWVVAGLTFRATSEGFIRVPADFVLSHEDIRTLLQKLQQQGKKDAPKKGWLR